MEILQLIVGALTLGGVAVSLYLAWRTHQQKEREIVLQHAAYSLQHSTYKRDELHNTVWTAESIGSFNKEIAICEPVVIALINLSKFTTVIKVFVSASGVLIHGDNVESHEGCCESIGLPEFTIAPNEVYRYGLRLHACEAYPEQAIVNLYVNNELSKQLVYRYDDQARCYWLAE